MSRGFLIFAFDNAKIAYGTTAVCCALCIKAHLHHNHVTLVCDTATHGALIERHGKALVARAFDNIRVIDPPADSNERRFFDGTDSHVLPWHNGTRHLAYDMTPYEETILIDSDFIVQDDWLDKAFGSVNPFMMNHHATPLDGNPLHETDMRLDPFGIPLYWATVVYFRKCRESAALFDMVAHVRDNYQFYHLTYDYPASLYRNDYAFSIAAHSVGGLVDCTPSLPCPTLLTGMHADELHEAKRGELVFLLHNRRTKIHQLVKVAGTSIHCMNKFSLLRHADRIIDIHA